MSNVLTVVKCPECGMEGAFIDAVPRPGEADNIRMPVELVSETPDSDYDYIRVDTDVITSQVYVDFVCECCGHVLTKDTDELMDMLRRGEVKVV